MPYHRAKKGQTSYEPKFVPIPKIDDQLVYEVDLSDAGIPPSACFTCTILQIDCTRIEFGLSCIQCQLVDARLCDHSKTIEELIIFHGITRNYALASDVTEVILSELVTSCKRAQTAATLYRDASEDLRLRFRWFVVHMFKCINSMGRDKFFDECFANTNTLPTIRRHVQLLIDQFNWAELPKEDRSYRILSGYTKADTDKFFELNFAALRLDDFDRIDLDDKEYTFQVRCNEADSGCIAYPPASTTLQDITDAKCDEGSGEEEEEEEEEEAALESEEGEAAVKDVKMGAPDDEEEGQVEEEEEVQGEEPEAGLSTTVVKSPGCCSLINLPDSPGQAKPKKLVAKKPASKKRTASCGQR
ncbi:hypothetical protein B0H16DRAFT_1460561 [Mycena metata]|uniref:Uncharacterized protein n=1 Tax=Mycena metata TaxID=1033252 RepID=A0AAD7IUQ1_9AGAR|nr:hypothetical protein B0H16DRAFT_1460561 [Mycena metata]